MMTNAIRTLCLSSILTASACTDQVEVADEAVPDAPQATSDAAATDPSQDPVIALRSTLMMAPLSVSRVHLAEEMAHPESPPGDILRLRARVRSEPGSHEARFALAEALRSDRDYGAAEQAYREAIRLDRSDAASHAGLARLLIGLGRHEEATEVLETALTAAAPTAELHSLLGTTAAKRRQYDLAISSFRRAVDMDPASERGHFDLAFTLERQGSTAAAISALRKGVDGIPGSVALRLRLAELLAATDAYREAVVQLRVLLDTDPALAPAIITLARLKRQRGDSASARKIVETGLSIDASNVDLMGELGILLLEAGQEEEAIPHLERAIYRDPEQRARRLSGWSHEARMRRSENGPRSCWRNSTFCERAISGAARYRDIAALSAPHEATSTAVLPKLKSFSRITCVSVIGSASSCPSGGSTEISCKIASCPTRGASHNHWSIT